MLRCKVRPSSAPLIAPILFAILTTFGLPVRLFAAGEQPGPDITSHLFPIPNGAFRESGSYEFLRPLMKDRQIVELGESLHMTSEFPQVRLGIIKFLHEQMGFDVVALEGSTVDFWIAQDELLNSSMSRADIERAQQRSFFGLWQTAEMRELLEYEAATFKTAHPLYITSYDSQPGLRIQNIFQALAERLGHYQTQTNGGPPAWVAGLQRLPGCLRSGFPVDSKEKEAALAAVDQFGQDIQSVAETIHSRFPNLPHAEMLKLLQENLRNSISLCVQRKDYSRARDTIDAGFVSTLLAGLPQPSKLIIWAHHNHVTYGYSTAGMGNVLHKRWGNRMYSIGVFAESGSFYGFLDEETPAPTYWSPPKGKTVDTYLASLSNQDYFLDLSALQVNAENPLFKTSTIRVEGSAWPATLATDYDAIVWIKQVHRPAFRWGFVLFVLGMDIVFFARVYWYMLLGVGALLIFLIFRRFKRRAERRRATT